MARPRTRLETLLRRTRRALAQRLILPLSGRAARGGPERIRRWGRTFGRVHHGLSWPLYGRLRRDIGVALAIERRQAARILKRAFIDNDRAVFEIIAQAHPDCDAAALVEAVEIENVERIDRLELPHGAILLGMHMGNGIAMAGRLARHGRPVHVVFRDPRRLPPGLLARSIEAVGAIPLALDRGNPTRSFRTMLAVLRRGELLYVLMDQANKAEGLPRLLLGKQVNMPDGVPRLAARTGSPVLPIDAVGAGDGWRFRVGEPLMADDAGVLLDRICASMEAAIRAHPELWAWHHRRWKRYHFKAPEPNLRG